MAKPPPNQPQGPQPPFINVLTLSGPLRIPNPNYPPKPERKQRQPVSDAALVWLDENYSDGSWKTMSPTVLQYEMAHSGNFTKPPSLTTLARLRGTRKK